MLPRVSVVIPLYNHSQYIRSAIESVIAQGPIVSEIVVVDDGSSDGSFEVVQGLRDLDPRLICWRHPNRGAHATINAGLLRTSGEFLTILNSDDAYVPGRLTRLVAALDLDQGSALVSSSIQFIDDAGASVTSAWHENAVATLKKLGDPALSLISANYLMTTSNFLFRRDLLDRIGLFAPLRYAHDLDFALRALALGERLAFVDENLLNYRMHANNTIREDQRKIRREWVISSTHYLHLASRANSTISCNWQAFLLAFDLLGEHGLSRALYLCLAYFARRPSDSLEHSDILTDNEFNRALETCL